MLAWLKAHRPGPLGGTLIGAVGFIGLMQIFPFLGCG